MSLCQSFAPLESRLRARMHEKIAIIDGRILWHGSLNILSHRDTHESMLRLESVAACQQLGRFLSAPAGRSEEDAPAFEMTTNPECPKCGGPTVWKEGRFGIYFTCEDADCDGKLDLLRYRMGGAHGSRRQRTNGGGRREEPGSQSRPYPEPGCGGTLRRRNGKYGPFLGCSNFPKCRHTAKVT